MESLASPLIPRSAVSPPAVDDSNSLWTEQARLRFTETKLITAEWVGSPPNTAVQMVPCGSNAMIPNQQMIGDILAASRWDRPELWGTGADDCLTFAANRWWEMRCLSYSVSVWPLKRLNLDKSDKKKVLMSTLLFYQEAAAQAFTSVLFSLMLQLMKIHLILQWS